MLEPFHFGQKEQLFGIYHPPSQGDIAKAVVICPPLFDDYRRTYRACAEMAKALSSKGLHVLRFDYFGTGDSWGELHESNTEVWIKDIHLAIDELVALTGLPDVTLLGIRFGATLASHCSHPGISQLILWDPIESGENYLSILSHNDKLKRLANEKEGYVCKTEAKSMDYSNFILGQELKHSMQRLSFNTENCSNDHLRLISTTNNFMTESVAKITNVSFPCSWDDFGRYYGELLMPKPVLIQIIDALCQK